MTTHPVILSRPDNWDKMTQAEKIAWAKAFLASLRSKT